MTFFSPRNLSRLGFALAWVVFGGSLFLPAWGDVPGGGCAQFVWKMLLDRNYSHSWEWLYFSAFNVTNLTLLILPILAFTPFGDRFLPAARWLAGGCVLHIFSWFIMGAANGNIAALQTGYYLWLWAGGLLFATCVFRVRQITAHR